MSYTCYDCGKECKEIPIPCPDNMEGCLVYHYRYEKCNCKNYKQKMITDYGDVK